MKNIYFFFFFFGKFGFDLEKLYLSIIYIIFVLLECTFENTRYEKRERDLRRTIYNIVTRDTST